LSNCTNCGAALTGKFCSNCGQKKFSPHDLTISKFILNFFEDFFKFDSNVFRTIRYLLFSPGFLSGEYVQGKIASYVKPLKLFVFTCIIVVFLSQYVAKNDYSFALDDLDFMQNNIEQVMTKKNITKEIFIEKFNSNYLSKLPFYSLLVVVVFTLILALVFIRQKRVIAEHLVFSLHFFTASLIFSLIDSTLSKFTDLTFYFFVFIVPLIYLFLAIKYFYRNKTLISLLTTFFLYIVYVAIEVYWIMLTSYITLKFFI